ncbi:hypothetical protein CAEBREN_12659 [Caenorhabditis brenneri]|uniref:C3H1-type domain-containing protein n=1 Tax=Caenorhabditis brenneri TaxID=135651 RepID=G0MDG3_CAEBE|nr:hypothetical protein CAEBREN_12659 [Caenorhabditis brenneri]
MSYPLNQSSIAPAPIASLMAINIKAPRDDCWLQVQICREFLRGECIRGATGCKFAHPPPALKYDSGRVKVCYDHLKNKCKRSECKYFHTPQHLSQEVLKAGKERMEGKREAEQLAKAAQELVAMPLPPLPQLNPYQHLLPLYNPYSSALIERALALTGQPIMLPMPAAPALNAFCFPPPPLAPLVPSPPGVLSRRRPAGSESSDATPPKRPSPEAIVEHSSILPLMNQQLGSNFVGHQYFGYHPQTEHNYNFSTGNAAPPPGFGYPFGQF